MAQVAICDNASVERATYSQIVSMHTARTTSISSSKWGIDLQYMPNTPKKPNRPRAMSRDRTSLIPNGKYSVLLYHIYTDAHNTVMPMRANKMWNGW